MKGLLFFVVSALICVGCKPEPEAMHVHIDFPEIVWHGQGTNIDTTATNSIPGVRLGVHVGSACWCIPQSDWEALVKVRPAAAELEKIGVEPETKEGNKYGPVYLLVKETEDGKFSRAVPGLFEGEQE